MTMDRNGEQGRVPGEPDSRVGGPADDWVVAATEDDLAAWMPDAERLVASFRFLDGG
jgi:hypothetical protein